ncbi:hypothetical protein [Candidatus Accumulibacter sp. ACC003]|uniref:hypothetical protein n=1 Tax=Candidatus Accumulibacter sp. ACC003 TaxID=2823334 RepID=UPI0025C50013|nr:hypothetical protein [Candidatus Accumulibacter sp. ACC003]
MTIRHLSPEIISLIHHVELNESGWWKKAIGQVIKGVLWKSQKPLSQAELRIGLKREVGIQLPDEVLLRQIEILSSQNCLTRMPNQSYKLTEATNQALTAAYHKACSEQELCRSAFLTSCTNHCPDLPSEKVWSEFSKALLNAVRVAGANLFHLIAGGNLEQEGDWLAPFLRPFPPEHTTGLRKTLSEFFAPANQACRNQVLRLMSAHFFAEASQLRPETLAVIESARKTHTIKVILDTNFLFSVLGLHDNPADDSVVSLVDIAKRNERHLKIKFYVLPGTLDEAQRTLSSQLHLVERIRTTVAMANVAVTQPLPSIAKKFFDAAKRSSGLTAETFFRPYIDDLRTILRDKGIHVLETPQHIYAQRQDVIDDVLSEQERETEEIPTHRRKGYDRLLHDAVLWHVVTDRRADNASTPFEVEYWAVSIDWRLIAFDRKKRTSNLSKLPAVLYPSNLVQFIQFWVPRSPDLEESLVDSLQLPLFFQSFDPEDEKATIKVLEAISRFENVTDFPESTLKVILANKALRTRLRGADASNDEIFTLVREELLAEHQTTVNSLHDTKGTLARTEAHLMDERISREQSQRLLADTNLQLDETNRKAAQIETDLAEALRTATNAEERAAKLEEKSLKQEQQLSAKDTFLRKLLFFIFFAAIPIVLGGVLGWHTHSFIQNIITDPTKTWGVWTITGAALILPLALACSVAPYYISKHPSLNNWWLARLLSVGKLILAAPLITAVTGSFQGGVWDGIKNLAGL